MYNRYIPSSQGYTRVSVEEEQRHGKQKSQTKRQYYTEEPKASVHNRVGSGARQRNFFATEDKNAGIAGILKSLHLEELDSGDILLMLIVLFLFLEGDNLEMVITLALMLLFSLGDEGQKE